MASSIAASRGRAVRPRHRLAPAAPGTELAAGYHVISHLNRGNRLDVYDAWSDERGSRCVLKTLRPDRAREGPARRALLREGRLLRELSHPHLVRAYEIASALDDERPVLVLETLGGETLSHLIHRLDVRGRRLPSGEVVVLAAQLASVLSYLHRHGWLHLDLKPSNIIVDAGLARLIDLSVARRPGRARAGVGTLEYMSPEQARGGPLTAASDVWGLGAVLYAALAATPPHGDPERGSDSWEPDTETTVGEATEHHSSSREGSAYPQLATDPVSIRHRRRVPSPIGRLIDRCLEREPSARPALTEVTTILDAHLATRGGVRNVT